MTAEDAEAKGRRYVVARADEVPEGGSLEADVGGRSVALFRLGGEYFALLNRCPHAGGPLCGGQVFHGLTSEGPGDIRLDHDSKLVLCPWHGWEFDLATGQSYCDPEKVRVRPYPVQVEPGDEITAGLEGHGRPAMGKAKGPYVATTFPISIENDYLVITMPR